MRARIRGDAFDAPHVFFFDAERRHLMTNWHTSRVVEFDDDDATSVQAARLAIKHLDFAFLQDKRIEIQQCECKWGWKRRCTRGMPPTGPFDGAMYRQLTAVVASVFARLQMGVMIPPSWLVQMMQPSKRGDLCRGRGGRHSRQRHWVDDQRWTR